jgi:hypothetical protein
VRFQGNKVSDTDRKPSPERLTIGQDVLRQEQLMRKQYLHLSAYACDMCTGPVVAGSVAVRENEISKETELKQVGAICLSCGHRQVKAANPERLRHFFPIEWEEVSIEAPAHPKTTYVEALNRAELH